MHSLRVVAICVLLPLTFLGTAGALTVFVPRYAPRISAPIAPDHFSLSIESDGWPEWVGKESRNEIFYNALENLKGLSGAPPRIRVGGKSQDRTFWSAAVDTVSAAYPPANASHPYPECLRLNIGDGFFRKSAFLPHGTKVIHGLNFATADDYRGLYLLNSILGAYLAPELVDANIRLDAIEIGNEPDLYKASPAKHAKDWASFAGNVLNIIPLLQPAIGEYGLKYWAGSLSSNPPSGFSTGALIKEGILKQVPAGPAVSSMSQHHYSQVNLCAQNSSLIQEYKAAIRSGLAEFSADISATKEQKREFIIGESGTLGCHEANTPENTANAVLWSLDYLLQAATLGVSRVFFHQRIGQQSTFLRPAPLTRSPFDGRELTTALPARVQPQYYAAIIAAEAVGNSDATTIAEFGIAHPAVAGYGFYENGTLAQAVFLHFRVPGARSLDLEEGAEADAKPSSVHISLRQDRITSGLKTVHLKRLRTSRLVPTDGSAGPVVQLRWGGVTYETEDARPSGREQLERALPLVGFQLAAGEAVLVKFL